MMEGPGADSGEKHEPAGDIDTATVDSLKTLDPNRPIREADMPAGQLRAGRRWRVTRGSTHIERHGPAVRYRASRRDRD